MAEPAWASKRAGFFVTTPAASLVVPPAIPNRVRQSPTATSSHTATSLTFVLWKAGAISFITTTKAAAQLKAKPAERATLLKITLPATYARLGKVIDSGGDPPNEFIN